jgi:hypothetical protein
VAVSSNGSAASSHFRQPPLPPPPPPPLHQNIESCGMSVLQVLKVWFYNHFLLILDTLQVNNFSVLCVQEAMESGVVDTRRASVCRELDEMFESIKSLVVADGPCDQLADQLRNKFIQPVG